MKPVLSIHVQIFQKYAVNSYIELSII